MPVPEELRPVRTKDSRLSRNPALKPQGSQKARLRNAARTVDPEDLELIKTYKSQVQATHKTPALHDYTFSNATKILDSKKGPFVFAQAKRQPALALQPKLQRLEKQRMDKQLLLDKAFKSKPRGSILPTIDQSLKSSRPARRRLQTPTDLASIVNPNMKKVMNELKIETVRNSKENGSEKAFNDFAK